jgi:hypothetical protein
MRFLRNEMGVGLINDFASTFTPFFARTWCPLLLNGTIAIHKLLRGPERRLVNFREMVNEPE